MIAWLAALALAASADPSIGWTPRRPVLGETPRLTVRVRVPGAPPEASPPRLRASEGILGDPQRSGPEEWTATLDLPGAGPPLLSIVSAAIEASDGRFQVAFAAVPLRGRAAIPVETEPRARVVIDLGAERLGPFTADERGHLEASVEVPPGVTSARVTVSGPGGRTERAVELAGSPPGRIALEAVPAGPGRLRLEVFAAGGARPEEVVLEADGARLSPPRPVPGHSDRLSAFAEGRPGEVRLRAWLRGAEGLRDEVTAVIAVLPPARLAPASARKAAPSPGPAGEERAPASAPLPPRTTSFAAGYRAQAGATGGAEMALGLGWPLARSGAQVVGWSALFFAHGTGSRGGASSLEVGLAPEGTLAAEIPGAALLAAVGPTVEMACAWDPALPDRCASAIGVSARLALAWRLPGLGTWLTAEGGLRELLAGGGRARQARLAGGLGVAVGLKFEGSP